MKPIAYLTLLFGSLTWLLAEVSFAEAQEVYLSVRKSKLRSAPKFLSSSVSDLTYGDSLNVIEEKEPWLKVKTKNGKTGYLHSSSASRKKIVLNSGATFSGTRANEEDIVLAGKGFGKNVESDYARAQGLSYADVNRMEQRKISDKEINLFAEQGRLRVE